MQPRLTIVIPTYNRPELLPRALDAALAQTVPVKIIVADDGDDPDKTIEIIVGKTTGAKDGLRHDIFHLRTGATNAWDNWRAGMEEASTEFVAWLQDDDMVSRHYAERIIAGFDMARAKGADPHVWMGRLTCSSACGRFGLWYSCNGPWVPMQDLPGNNPPTHFTQGAAIAASMYFTSWSLSPAIAYVNGPRLKASLAAMPLDCDIFVERIIPAEMAVEGGFVADPVVCGHWVQHEDNLSRKQHADQPRQTKLLVQHMDGLLDRLPRWREQFAAWLTIVPAGQVIGWLGNLDQCEREGGKGRYIGEIRGMMIDSLRGRVKVMPDPRRWWRKAINWATRRAAL